MNVKETVFFLSDIALVTIFVWSLETFCFNNCNILFLEDILRCLSIFFLKKNLF